MLRETETLDRRTFDILVADMTDGDVADQLWGELADWQDGDTCDMVEVTTDSLGRLDSMSSPRPADN